MHTGGENAFGVFKPKLCFGLKEQNKFCSSPLKNYNNFPKTSVKSGEEAIEKYLSFATIIWSYKEIFKYFKAWES